jgi:hypothetical protein
MWHFNRVKDKLIVFLQPQRHASAAPALLASGCMRLLDDITIVFHRLNSAHFSHRIIAPFILGTSLALVVEY